MAFGKKLKNLTQPIAKSLRNGGFLEIPRRKGCVCMVIALMVEGKAILFSGSNHCGFQPIFFHDESILHGRESLSVF